MQQNNNQQQSLGQQQQQQQQSATQLQQASKARQGYTPNPIVSERCWTFKITPEERRHRDFQLEQSKILKEIMLKTNTKIEVTTTKDGALNFCIIGKEQNLKAAKSLVLNDFQTNVTLTVNVPKSIHGRLLGPKGARLASIQDETQTKISIPRKEEDSDIIKIVGIKNNAELAVRSIQKIVREFAGKTVEKVTIGRIYLLFVTGPFNENLKRWAEMGAKVSTSSGLAQNNPDKKNSKSKDEKGSARGPDNNNDDQEDWGSDEIYSPLSAPSNEVTFTIVGETTVVSQIKGEILQIYEEKQQSLTTVAIEIKKAQHRYIVGVGGQNLRNFFAKTGVAVELPKYSLPTETITLYGERSKIAPALSELYILAHSETDEFIQVENWLHKYLIGPRKTNFIDLKTRGVDAKAVEEDVIRLHGPPDEVESVRAALQTEYENIKRNFVQKQITFDSHIYGYVIGKGGATVDQIRKDSGAYISVPKDKEDWASVITIEGTREAVAIAEEKIDAIIEKYKVCRTLNIDQQLHGTIIGRGGEKIRSIREKFSQVVFTFPEQGSKNNEITILGPEDEVEECYKYLDEFHKKLQESNHQIQVPIKQEVINYLSDAQQAIRRIKLDHRVKIDLFINKQQQETSQQHAKPQQTSNNNKKESSKANANNDEVTSTSDVAASANKSNKNNKVKKDNNEPTNKQVNGVNSADSGKQQAKKADKQQGAKADTTSSSYALIIGKKEDVDEAKIKFVKLLEELATTTEFEVKITPELRDLLGPKTKVYKQLLDDFQQKIVISFPPQQRQPKNNNATVASEQDSSSKSSSGGEVAQPANGVSPTSTTATPSKNNKQSIIEIVKIRGPKNIAKKAAKNFETLVLECQEKLDKNFQMSLNVDATTIDKIMSTDKLKLNKIREAHSVKLIIPDKRGIPFKTTCIIVGYEKNVKAAMEEFKTLVKDVEERIEETIDIPSQFHPRLIGAGGRNVKKLMEQFKIGVKFARQGDPNPDSVVLFGSSSAVSAAKEHMLKQASMFRV